jgi:hypothetical protein
MRINSSGKVGIGVAAPLSNLDIDVANVTSLGLRSQTGVIVGQYTGAPAVGNRAQIGLGYGNTYTNVSIGAVRTSAAAYGTDDFIIATKSGTADTAPTERIRILATGGITFNGDTAAANALDDYEEGTFTPEIFGATTGGTGTYSIRRGGYIKIGKLVYAQIYIGWTAHTGTGAMRLSGLPFTAENTNPYGYGAPNMSYASGLSFNYNQLGGYVSGNSTILVFNTFESQNLTSVSMDGTVAELLFNLHYIAQ